MWKKIIVCICCVLLVFGVACNLKAEEVENEEQQLMDQVKDFMTQYSEESYIYKIIEWAIDSGVLAALFFVVVRYKKYKNKTVDEVIGALGDNFKDLAKTQLKDLTNELTKLKESQETIMKVLILMQDSTAQGKIALLDFLGAKNENLQAQVEQVEQEIQAQQEIAEQVNQAVADDYNEIKF